MVNFEKYNLEQPLDISIPLRASAQNVRAWYVDSPQITPVQMGDWVGDVNKGASVNFRNVFFNPHGHGTHTECVGHISSEFYSINQCLKRFFFKAIVVSVNPVQYNNTLAITHKQLNIAQGYEAIVIRTLPNNNDKLNRHYSNTHPPYLTQDAALHLRHIGIKHVLIDLPSVDPEVDEGKLLAHKAFWNYPENPVFDATITELIYVPDSVKDGEHLLNLQIAPFENDASPSKPVLYPLK